jgi:hypothetical protein
MGKGKGQSARWQRQRVKNRGNLVAWQVLAELRMRRNEAAGYAKEIVARKGARGGRGKEEE